MAVGAYGGQGSTFIHRRGENGVWETNGHKLATSESSGTSARRGCSVSLSGDGNIVLIGAFGYSGNGQSNRGAVKFYKWTGSQWDSTFSPVISLPQDEQENEDKFGTSVAISYNGLSALVGCPGKDVNTGKVYTLAYTSGQWGFVGTGLSDTLTNQGISVSMSSDGDVSAYGGLNGFSVFV